MLKQNRFPRIMTGLILLSMAQICACGDSSNPVTPAATYRQVDRTGIPGINTIFNHPPDLSKVDFNKTGPENDSANYTAQFELVLRAVANDSSAATATAAALLPDELPVNLASVVSDFAMLDGRRLADDAVDVGLALIIDSSLSSLYSDNVDVNDVPFLTSFPYLAPPN